MSCDFVDSAEFRDHIRNLLYEYSINHYTTNYIEFTEDLVGEFVETLAKIPLVDRYSLTRLPDPFDTFCQINSFSTLTPYDETPQTTKDAILYLKNAMKTTISVARTEKAVYNDDYGPPCPTEPFMPALTRKARQNTPRLGKLDRNIPDTHERLLTTQNIEVLEIEPIEEKKLVFEDLLDIKHHIKPDELSAVQSLLRSTADMMRSQTGYKNIYLQPEYLDNIHLPKPFQPEEVLQPLFTKDRLPASGIPEIKPTPKWCDAGFKSFSEIPALVLKTVSTADLEVSPSRQNLVIVDGWETIKSSPPSTQNSVQSDEDQLDELHLPSTPDTDPPLVTEFLAAKMEPILMPRSRQIGGSSGIGPHILAGKSLGSFLQPLLSPITLTSETKAKSVEDAENQRQASPVPSSMVGEADPENEPAPASDSEQDLDGKIKSLYAGKAYENIIMQETLDDKPNMMMEVPDLPGPNVHPPNDMFLPKGLSDFLVPKRANDQKPAKRSTLPAHQFLTKAKGISSLYTSLSWIMFKTDKQLPSNEEAIGVASLLGDKASVGSSNSDLDLDKINALLETMDISGEERLPRWDAEDTASDRFAQHQAHDDFQILQTREERWRLARLEGRLADLPDEDEEAIEDVPDEDVVSDDDERLEDDRPTKRFRVDELVCNGDLEEPVVCDSRSPVAQLEELEDPVALDDVQILDQPAEPDLDVILDAFANPESNLVDTEPAFAPLDDDDNMQCDDFAESFDEDKENWPPNRTPSPPILADDVSSDYHTPEHMRSYLAAQYGFPNELDTLSQCYNDSDLGAQGLEAEEQVADEGSFQQLSFGSKQQDSQMVVEQVPTEAVDEVQEIENPQVFDDEEIHNQDEDCDDLSYVEEEETRQQPEETQHFSLLLAPSIASHSLGISSFAQLRARKVSSAPQIPAPQLQSRSELAVEPTPPEVTREDVVDQNTLKLPAVIHPASSVHRYMASIAFIQKNSLVRALSSEECAVELAERPTLVGVDLILDPYSAVIILSLFTLSARCDSYIERVSQQSSRYSKILVIFEAYPEHLSKRTSTRYGADTSSAASELRAYTPPIIKAIKKFRRDLNIAEACGTKDPNCKVTYAFADTVNEAALFIRLFGDQVEAQDETQGVLWGDREWLTAESIEDEEARLGQIAGMNQFKASIILCQVTLQEYVDMTAQQRIDAFAPYVGMSTMESCNAYLDARLQEIFSESNTDEVDDIGNENQD